MYGLYGLKHHTVEMLPCGYDSLWMLDGERLSKSYYQVSHAQIHKYTITPHDEVPERPNKWYFFEKRIVQGYQKLYFHVPNAHFSTPDHYPRSLRRTLRSGIHFSAKAGRK